MKLAFTMKTELRQSVPEAELKILYKIFKLQPLNW
jgi:hypothetical protein